MVNTNFLKIGSCISYDSHLTQIHLSQLEAAPGHQNFKQSSTALDQAFILKLTGRCSAERIGKAKNG